MVPSPDGRYVAYQTMRSDTPMLYVHDTIASRERLLARGAQSVAWSRDGRIAYFKADHERYGQRPVGYVGQVVVQTLDGAPTVWTRRAASYEILAWARDELLVRVDYCLDPGCPRTPDTGVYALRRSGKLRPLRLETVLALSPDGRYALGPIKVPFENYSPLVRLVRIESGKTVTTLNAKRLFQRALPGLKLSWELVHLEYASWRGSEIAASFVAGNHSVLAVFRLRGQRLVLESIFRAPAGVAPKIKYGPSFGVPFLTGPGNARIIVTADATAADERSGYRAVLVCSRAKRSCVLGGLFPWGSSYRTFNVVRNQSRPLAPIG